MEKLPLLCRLGSHKKYHYLPKVGGDLGEISIACKRCGYGLRYFAGTWDIKPEEVQRDIKEQAELEYGRVLRFFPTILGSARQMRAALNYIKDKFTPDELAPVIKQVEEVEEFERQSKAIENR